MNQITINHAIGAGRSASVSIDVDCIAAVEDDSHSGCKVLLKDYSTLYHAYETRHEVLNLIATANAKLPPRHL